MALNRRGSLMVWFDPQMKWFSACGNGKRGRDLTFSDPAIQFCLMIKILYGLPLRQGIGFVDSLIRPTTAMASPKVWFSVCPASAKTALSPSRNLRMSALPLQTC